MESLPLRGKVSLRTVTANSMDKDHIPDENDDVRWHEEHPVSFIIGGI